MTHEGWRVALAGDLFALALIAASIAGAFGLAGLIVTALTLAGVS